MISPYKKAPALIIVACFGLAVVTSSAFAQMMSTGSMENPTPPVKGFYKDQQVLFIHTEASDPTVALMLTKMMGPKVLVVPSLAKVPRNLLGAVYVFRNGVRGDGPFGYQPDVFDSAPGDASYTPLRLVNLVTWSSTARPKDLRSANEIRAASDRKELATERSGVVVNMPMLTWPGGKR